MSRIGKKPIPLPRALSIRSRATRFWLKGPRAKVTALIAEGISLETTDGTLHVNRDTEKHAAVHGLTRALVFNAVHGVDGGLEERTGYRRHRVSRRVEGQGHSGVHAGLLASD